MSGPLNLSDLKAARAAMTMPLATYTSDDEGCVRVVEDGDVSAVVARCKSPTRAAGIVATHNAAGLLIEIAEATKTLQAEGWDFRSTTMDRLLAALAQVTLAAQEDAAVGRVQRDAGPPSPPGRTSDPDPGETRS